MDLTDIADQIYLQKVLSKILSKLDNLEIRINDLEKRR